MHISRQKPVFENRYDAGRQLAARLDQYKNKSAVILAIPNGGVAVALRVAVALDAELDLIISRKIPLPLSPEGGCGAVTDDGTMILNEEAVRKNGLTREQIDSQASEVRASIRQRSLLYHKDRPLVPVRGKIAILIDDGLASGYTMMAAVESVRHHRPKELVVAVPVASQTALNKVSGLADKVVTCIVGSAPEFYLADFYAIWHEPTDDEVIRYREEHRRQRFQAGFETKPGR